jgi:ABC-type antimicrobial peptide transport system permease subunit
VSQRTKEIGIRMALGADRYAVLDLVLRGGLKMAAVGVAAGAVLAAVMTRIAGGLLFGVSAFDPAIYAGLAAVLLLSAAAAAYLPARRAAALEPLRSFRQ